MIWGVPRWWWVTLRALLLGSAAILMAEDLNSVAGGVESGHIVVGAYPEGILRCEFPVVKGLARVPLSSSRDVLFPEGELLGRFTAPQGAMITVSFDASTALAPEEQAAFRAVATDRMQGGSGRHAVFPRTDRDWVLQVFVAPSEHIVSAQTFVADHPLALVFWLPRSEIDPLRHPLVETILADLALNWEAADEFPAD